MCGEVGGHGKRSPVGGNRSPDLRRLGHAHCYVIREVVLVLRRQGEDALRHAARDIELLGVESVAIHAPFAFFDLAAFHAVFRAEAIDEKPGEIDIRRPVQYDGRFFDRGQLRNNAHIKIIRVARLKVQAQRLAFLKRYIEAIFFKIPTAGSIDEDMICPGGRGGESANPYGLRKHDLVRPHRQLYIRHKRIFAVERDVTTHGRTLQRNRISAVSVPAVKLPADHRRRGGQGIGYEHGIRFYLDRRKRRAVRIERKADFQGRDHAEFRLAAVIAHTLFPEIVFGVVDESPADGIMDLLLRHFRPIRVIMQVESSLHIKAFAV